MRLPGRRAILAMLVPLALVLLALHFMAALALGDLARAASEDEAGASDLLVQGIRPVVARSDGRIVSVLSADGRSASVRPGLPPSLLALPSETTLLTGEEDGRIVVTRLGARTAVERAIDSIGAHLRAYVWEPVSGFARDRILPLALQVDPLSVPASARPRRIGVYRPCRDCPEMVEIGPGMDLLGQMLWQRSEGAKAREAIATPGFRIARAPVTTAEWAACGCPQVGRAPAPDGRILVFHPDDAAPYFAWLATRTGRTFRIPTSQEWELAARASERREGVAPRADSIGEWVCIPAMRGGVRECSYARREPSGGIYNMNEGPTTRAALRLVEDERPATAGQVTPPRQTPAQTTDQAPVQTEAPQESLAY